MSNRQQLEQAIAIQESLRGTIDDAIIDATVGALRAQLTALEPAPVPESRRALATILFVDLAGHTDLIQGRDPEEIMEIIDRALERLAEPIARHDGRIVRYQGDGFKAVFGLPASHENDPDNAVMAAMDILHEAAAVAAELETERDMPGFKVRVGIDTGLVLIGGGTEGEDAVTGLPVNLAARLESAAEPGTILISHHTYQHIRGVFDFQPLDPIQVKGFPEPVPVYRVLRRKARSFRTRRRGVEGVETRMIGRAAELATLQLLYRQMAEQGASVSAVVVGDAGLGKSRLLYELENWADLHPANVQLYRGRARLETQRLPYGLLRDVFVFRCGIHDDDTAAVVRAKLVDCFRAVMGTAGDVEMKAHVVGYLLGYDFANSPHLRPLLSDARQFRGQALFYMTEYFKIAAGNSPITILLEDLHWADDSSLDAVTSLSLALLDHPVMILGATRPTLYERRPGWMADHPANTRINLAQLDPAESGLLVAEILKRAESIPTQLRELVVERAEGNPFYVEELIKMLIEDGLIVKGEETWHVEAARLADLHVPPTLTGVLQARLDTLPADERDALQVASVIGRLFWDAAVDYISQPQTGPIDKKLWPALRRRELVFLREETAFEGTEEYLFKHAILRDVTYESVLRRLRREFHHRAAEWLIQAGGDRVDEYADQIAAHFAAAGAAREEAEWQGRAGKNAAARFALAEAIDALSRALELLPADEAASRYELLLEREAIYHLQGRRELQAADLAALTALAEQLGDSSRSAEVALRNAYFCNVTGDFPSAIAAAATAGQLATSIDDLTRQARARLAAGHAYRGLGQYDDAREEMGAALGLTRLAGAVDVEAEALRAIGVTAQEQGDPTAQRESFELSLALAREVGDRRSERRTLNSLGVMEENEGNYERAMAYFEESLALGRAIGDRTGVGTVLGNLGVTVMDTGDPAAARAYFEEATNIARETGDLVGVHVWLLNLAFVVATEGDVDGALALYDEARRGFEEAGDRSSLGYVLHGIGRVLLEAGRAAEAIVSLRAALALREELAQPHLSAESRLILAEALLFSGELPAARELVEHALPTLETTGLETNEDTQRGLWAAYQVLAAGSDARAATILNRLHDEIEGAAARLPAAVQQRYRDMMPWKREAIQCWEQSI